MNSKKRLYLLLASSALFGTLILFSAYPALRSELIQREHETAFLKMEHPPDTSLIQFFGLEVNYYPASYIDDSIRFKASFVTGQVRSYSGDWNDLKALYANQALEVNNSNPLPVTILPIEIQRGAPAISFKPADDLNPGPFEYDFLDELGHHSALRETLKTVSEEQNELYLVYVVVSK